MILSLSKKLQITCIVMLVLLLPSKAWLQGGQLFNDEILHEIRFTNVDTNGFIQNREYQSVDVSIDGVALNNIGFRKKGNISASHPNNKFPFKVKTNRYEDGLLYDGIREFTLHNNFEDPSMLREKMTYDLLAELGLHSLRTAFAKVYINNHYWGLYTLVEAKDELYRRAFDDDDGAVLESLDFGDMCYLGPNQSDYYFELAEEYHYIVDNGSEELAWQHFPAMLDAANNAPESEYIEQVSEQLNILDFTKYQAANVFLLNFDSYIAFRGNQLYYYEENTGIWQVIPWDFNASFGLWNTNQASPATYPLFPNSITSGCIAEHIANIPELRSLYLNTICELANDYASVDRIQGTITNWRLLIEDAVLSDNRKDFTNDKFALALGGTYFAHASEQNMPGMLAFAMDRAAFIEAELEAENFACTITSTQNNEPTHFQLSCYPNPTRSGINLSISEPESVTHLEIISPTGVIQMHYDGYQKQLDLSALPAGTYFLRISRKEYGKLTIPIVKQ